MYSLVLMMALGNGAAPGIDTYQPKQVASLATHGHTLNRWGCHGCWGCSGCHGCWGCYGCGGCRGCWGCWGCYGGRRGCWGCYGGWCYGCWGCYGGYAYGGYATSGFYGTALVAAPTTATIVVSLPADAKLSVEDQPTTSKSERRTFVSTPLQSGRQYYYTLKAEINRDGKPVTETRRVIVQAGKETQVKFDFNTSLAQR